MLKRTKRSSKVVEDGFSLLEVVVAFALTAIVLAILLPELHTARTQATRAAELQKVLVFAEGQMEALRLLPANAAPVQSGTFGPWRWRASLEVSAAPAPAPVWLRSIHLEVFRRQRDAVLLDLRTKQLVQAVPD